jgi:type II secretory pathway pseudopilin PulG
MELLTVMAIIALIVAITVPAIRALGKSNDQIQAANLMRAMLSEARSLAISQHRMVGVAFFEETAGNSPSVHANTTAVVVCVEAYDQSGVAGHVPPGTQFDYYGSMRQYLPEGIRLAVLSDLTGLGNVVAEDTQGQRIILFDANGQLALRSDVLYMYMTPGGPMVVGPFNSYPGFFLYNKAEYDQQTAANKIGWLKKNSTVVIVNGNTGGLLK